jgi:radical SAM superfamily enzyme YgiQ (UPF0313 family)
MARILLAVPPVHSHELFSRGVKTSASFTPPLGPAYIASYLRAQGHECRIYDGIAEPVELERLAATACQYDVVGVTAVTAYVLRSIELVRAIKARPSCPTVVVGGPHVSVLPESLLAQGADFAVVGEGEETMGELVECLAAGANAQRLREVRGIGFYDEGKYHYTGDRPRIEPLDVVPPPALDLLPMHLYFSSIARATAQPSLPLLTSRGCAGVCSFCSKRSFGTKVRYFSVARIVEDFFLLRDRYGARDVAVFDDSFVSDEQVAGSVCESLRSRGFDRSWSVEAGIDGVSRPLLRTLRDSGCTYIAYGIESGSQRVLDRINKRISKDQVRETIALTKEAGIHIRGYFMLGFPGETAAEMEETIRFAMELDIDLASFTLLVPLPGTVEYRRAQESGTFDPEYYMKGITSEFHFLDSPVYVPEGMTAQTLLAIHRSAYKRYYYRPKVILRKLSSVRSAGDVWSLVRGAYTLASKVA